MDRQDKPPIQIGRERYFIDRLNTDLDKDYKCLDLCYDMLNKIIEQEDKMDIKDFTDNFLKVNQQINITHDRIRKRLNL